MRDPYSPTWPWEPTEVAAISAAAAARRTAEHIAELEAAVDRVRRLHSQDDSLLAPGKWCPGCGEVAPCRTIRALNGSK